MGQSDERPEQPAHIAWKGAFHNKSGWRPYSQATNKFCTHVACKPTRTTTGYRIVCPKTVRVLHTRCCETNHSRGQAGCWMVTRVLPSFPKWHLITLAMVEVSKKLNQGTLQLRITNAMTTGPDTAFINSRSHDEQAHMSSLLSETIQPTWCLIMQTGGIRGIDPSDCWQW